MVVSAAHREHWRRRRQAEADAIALRRCLAEQQAKQAASILRAHWPEIGAVWLFGSVLEPMEVLDEALLRRAEPEQCLPIDLVRLEALPPHWQQRLRDQARQLV